MRSLPEAIRDRIAADEALLSERDALRARAAAARRRHLQHQADEVRRHRGRRCASPTVAELSGIALMWGCMDESAISIAAALHAAFASPATRYLDLDGSLDLARDVVDGGFVIENGVMRTARRPGSRREPITAGDLTS